MNFTTSANMRALLITLFATLTVTLIISGTPAAALCCKDDESGMCADLPISACPNGSSHVLCCGSDVDELMLKKQETSGKRGGKMGFKADKEDQA